MCVSDRKVKSCAFLQWFSQVRERSEWHVRAVELCLNSYSWVSKSLLRPSPGTTSPVDTDQHSPTTHPASSASIFTLIQFEITTTLHDDQSEEYSDLAVNNNSMSRKYDLRASLKYAGDNRVFMFVSCCSACEIQCPTSTINHWTQSAPWSCSSRQLLAAVYHIGHCHHHHHINVNNNSPLPKSQFPGSSLRSTSGLKSSGKFSPQSSCFTEKSGEINKRFW